MGVHPLGYLQTLLMPITGCSGQVKENPYQAGVQTWLWHKLINSLALLTPDPALMALVGAVP